MTRAAQPPFPSDTVPGPPPLGEVRLWGAAVALVLYLLADRLLQAIALPQVHIIPWYPGAGLGLVFLVLTGWRGVPVLAAARVLLAYVASPLGEAGWRTAPGALVIASGYALAATMIRRRVALDGNSWGVDDAAWLTGAAAVGALIGGVTAALEAALVFGRAWSEVPRFGVIFALGDAAGALVVAPVALLVVLAGVERVLRRRRRVRAAGGAVPPHARVAGPVAPDGPATAGPPLSDEPPAPEARRRWWLEAFVEAVLVLAVLGTVWLAGFDDVPRHGYLCFVPLTWIAIRHGVRRATVTIAAYGAACAIMALAGGIEPARVPDVQLLLLTLGASGLFLGAARSAGLETDARYWQLLASAHEGVWRLDPAGRTVYVNRRMADMLGMTPSAVIGCDARDFIAPEALDVWLAERAIRAGGGSSTYETTLLRRDGRRLHVVATASPVRSRATATVTGSVAVITDVTGLLEVQRERDAATAASRHAQRLLEAVFRASRDALILLRGSDGLVVDVNETWCEMTGLRCDDVTGRPVDELGLHDHPFAALAQIEAILDRGERAENIEFDFWRHHADGSTERRQARITASQVMLEGERYVFIAARDITTQKLEEERRAQVHRLEELGRLAGGVAHDFNNLLTIVQSYAQLVRAAVAAGEPVQAEDVLEIERAAVRGSALTKRLIAFSRHQPVEPRPLDVNAAVRAAEGLLRPVLGSRLRGEYELADGLPPVLLDAAQFDQVLLNLVLNARDAMPEGGVLTVATHRVEVAPGELSEVAADAAGTFVVLEVRDTGIGMDEATLRRIFEPFFTTKPPGQGTGLGLPVVFGIVRQAGGTVRVQSSPGGGTCFSVYLPVVADGGNGADDPPATHADPAAGAPAQPPATDGVQVLLVEDDPEVRRIARRVLGRAGYAVIEAEHGGDALAKLEALARDARLPSVVLSDVLMPVMDGGELAATLATRFPTLPVVLMSGHVGQVGTLQPGGNVRGAVVAKPFTATGLLQAVEGAISRA